MNICYIPSAKLSYESGSTLYARACINFLAQSGHKVYVICLDSPKESNVNVKYIHADILEHPVIDDYFVFDLDLTDSIIRIIRKVIDLTASGIKLDIIHAHYATINAIAAVNIKTILGIPFVISCFGRDVFNGFDNDVRYRRMIKYSIVMADYIIASNESVKKRIKDITGINNDNLCVLPMPVNDNVFSRKEVTVHEFNQNNALLLNVVSCFAIEKGIDVTLNAMKLVKENNIRAKLYLIGMDENPNKKNYKRYCNLIEMNHLQKDVVFLGQLPNDCVAKWLQKTDIVIDSRLQGNYSSVILEALATGNAIVASDVKGNKEFIIDKHNGLLYKNGDEKDLAQKIETIVCDKHLLNHLEENAYNWYKNNKNSYSLTEHVSKLEKIYRNILRHKIENVPKEV